MDFVIDVEAARAATPGCTTTAHFNNAGSSLPTQRVLDAQLDYLRTEATVGGYEAALQYADQFDTVYADIARLIGADNAADGAGAGAGAGVGADAGEIALMESASAAWNTAFSELRLGRGDRILTGRAEYISNVFNLLPAAERDGVVVDVVDNDDSGQLDVSQLADRIGPDVKLIALTHVPTSSGLVNPAEAVGAVARAAGVPYLLDACQSIGQLDVDVQRIGCDLLTATGRKFLRAPRGTGFLFVRQAILDRLEPTYLEAPSAAWVSRDQYELRAGARRFEALEHSFAARAGLCVAVEEALQLGMPAIESTVVALAAEVRARLRAIKGVTVHDMGVRQGAIVTFTVAGRPAAEVVAELRKQDINTWPVAAAFAQWDLGMRRLDAVVRASVHYYNDASDLDRLCTAVEALAN